MIMILGVELQCERWVIQSDRITDRLYDIPMLCAYLFMWALLSFGCNMADPVADVLQSPAAAAGRMQ